MMIVFDSGDHRRSHWSSDEIQEVNLLITFATTPGIYLVQKCHIVEMKLLRIDADNWT